MGLTMIFFVFTEKSNFQGKEGSQKTNIEWRDCLNRGTWTVCRFKEAWLGKKERVVFL